MDCPKCMTAIHEGESFCRTCGASVATGKIGDSGDNTVRVRVINKSGGATAATTINAGGRCSYHQNQIATNVCGRCGRSICHACVRNFGGVTFCVECAAGMQQPASPTVSRVATAPAYRRPSVSMPATPGAGASLNGLAITSLICGILGFLVIPMIIAIVFGFVAISQINASGGRQGGKEMAIIGVVFSFVWLGIILIWILVAASTPYYYYY